MQDWLIRSVRFIHSALREFAPLSGLHVFRQAAQVLPAMKLSRRTSYKPRKKGSRVHTARSSRSIIIH